MRDTKSLFLLVFALVLITISFVLISIWGYHFYFQNKSANIPVQKVEMQTIDSNTTRDSLQTVYDTTVRQFDYNQDSVLYDRDSLTQNLDHKIAQYNILRNEIADILKNKTSTADMIIAGEKIRELQQTVDLLRNKTNEVAEENKRLNNLLKQLMNERPKISPESKIITSDIKTSIDKNVPSSFVVSNINLAALAVENASQTDRLLEGSFYLKNISGQSNSAAIEIIILQPNGSVLQNSAWESGTFETPSGRKVYSVKIHFDYAKDENKRLDFSLSAARLQKGNYVLQIYHNGIMIGKMIKNLA